MLQYSFFFNYWKKIVRFQIPKTDSVWSKTNLAESLSLPDYSAERKYRWWTTWLDTKNNQSLRAPVGQQRRRSKRFPIRSWTMILACSAFTSGPSKMMSSCMWHIMSHPHRTHLGVLIDKEHCSHQKIDRCALDWCVHGGFCSMTKPFLSWSVLTCVSHTGDVDTAPSEPMYIQNCALSMACSCHFRTSYRIPYNLTRILNTLTHRTPDSLLSRISSLRTECKDVCIFSLHSKFLL